MHKETFKVAPFNLDNFKSKAVRFTSLIAEKSGHDKFKSKERYNLLAQSLGYKDHGALVKLSRSWKISNNNAVFSIFVYEKHRKKIIHTFCSNLPSVSNKHIEAAVKEMIVDERLEISNFLRCTPMSRESFVQYHNRNYFEEVTWSNFDSHN
ncbi:hypothetical protein E2I22_04700 [Vibrio vulnificus]|uniref:hypothetical protein n=1 Tax=Vibrio vulnificus TaxID=672 RepID=UPI0005C6D7C5|nr:hypothetical protein [Vibrio vulnificus]QBN13552.1 hypothetical protein E2I22_04700 [Vibrio vulnificus]